MNFLFETYEFLYPIILGSDSRQCSKRWDPSQEVEMFVMAFMTLLRTGGAMFCVRFLVALCKEREPRRIGYWVRRRLRSGTDTMAELRQSKKQVSRAA
jgi:hypothetical protein